MSRYGQAFANQTAAGNATQGQGQLMPPPPPQQQAGQPGGMPPPPQGAQQPPYPSPPGTMPPSGPNDPFQQAPPNQVAPATPAPALGYPPGQGPSAGGEFGAEYGGQNVRPVSAQNPNGPDLWNPQASNEYGGQQIAGADPSQADYNSVQGYSDQAHDAARRYLDPQQASQNRRHEQELINKGIDPNSAQGQEMSNQLAMQQADADNAASFSALQFGQGVQNQMSQQEQFNQGLAGQMQQALWGNQLGASGQDLSRYQGDQNFNLGNAGLNMQGQIANQQNALQKYGMDQNFMGNKYGQDLNYNLGVAGQDLQRYGMDQGHQLGMGQLDLGRQGQNFNEMMGMDAADFRNQQFNQQQQNWQDQMLYNMMMGNQGFAPGQVGSDGHTNTEAGIAGGIGSIMSDRRLKHNVVKVGEIQGTNLYQFDYLGEEGSGRIGVMAQEVPWAAVETASGYLAIDPRKVF